MTRHMHRSFAVWLAVATTLFAVVAAGCGYDKTGNEQELLAIFAAEYPEARWGVECTDPNAADSNPSCTMGFELRTPAEPTLLQLFEFASEAQHWAIGTYLRNEGSILPARRDAQGTFQALDIQCPGLDPGGDPRFSIDYAFRGLPSPRKLRLMKERGCRLADKITLSTVGK